ncbi:MAG: hypothetical protein IIC90_12040 [Chloroflexi bacterium]|nr:hypothetical protein [Chloroflexota bacterium]
MIIIGIDPGLTGAVARIGHVDVVGSGPGSEVWDTPTAKDGKRTVFLPREMRRLLLDAIAGQACSVFIERVHSMPKQGVSSSFNFGMGYGIWIGLIHGLGYSIEHVTPNAWKKEMMAGMSKEKDASRVRAQELFPDADLHLVKHHGRADALLIAEYGRRRYGS